MSVPDGEPREDGYLAINPNRVVPSLTNDGKAIHDSSVIIEYLHKTAVGRARMSPSDPVERAAMRSWMRAMQGQPGFGTAYLTGSRLIVPTALS